MVYRAFERAFEDKMVDGVSDDVIFVSEITYCLRKAYFLRRNPRPFSKEKIVVLGLGTAVHFLVEKYLDYDGLLSEKSVAVNLGAFTLKGRADLIVDNHIVELKTVNRLPDRPLDHHLLQIQAYLFMFDREEGFLVYIEKRKGRISSFKIRRENKYWIEIVNRARRLHEHLKMNKVPEPEPSPLCRFCEYKGECGEGDS